VIGLGTYPEIWAAWAKVITPEGVPICRMSRPGSVRNVDALNLTGGVFAPTDAGTGENDHRRQGFLAVNKRHITTLEAIP
jgi:hypothetical protein